MSRGTALPTAAMPAAPMPVFPRLAVVGLLGVGLACFVGFVLLLTLARAPNARDGGGHAASRSAIGFAGVAALLRDTGRQVVLGRPVRRGAALQDGDAGPALLVLTPGPDTSGPQAMPAYAGKAVLIVLPKWRTSAVQRHPGWVWPEGLLPEGRVLGVLPGAWRGLRLNRRTDTARPELHGAGPVLRASAPVVHHLQTLAEAPAAMRAEPGAEPGAETRAGLGWMAVLRDGAGGIVLGRAGASGPYVLADPDLLDNMALAEADGAEVAAGLIGALAAGGPVAFDTSLTGYGRTHDLLRRVLEPPLLGATLCAVAAAVLAGLLSLRRFGPVQASLQGQDSGPHGLADNAAALIALAGREPRMALPYAELTRLLAGRAAAPRHLAGAGLDAYLDRDAARRGLPDTMTALLAAAGKVRGRAGLLRLARRLHRFRLGMLHGRL